MRRTILFALCFVCCCFATAQTFSPSERADVRLTLQDCFKLANDNNLSLRAANAGIEQSRLMQGTAWDIDKADLTLSQDPTSGGSPDNSLSLSQTIDFPTRYVARRHQLKAETASRRAEASVIANRVNGQVAALYYTLVYQREKLNILQRQDTILRHYADIATKRYKAGEVRQLEPLNANRLLHENQLEMNVTAAEYSNSQSELARLLGTTKTIEPMESTLRTIGSSSDAAQSLNLSSFQYFQTPEGQLAESRLHVADEAVKVEKSAYAPSLTLALRTQMVIKGWNPYHVNRGWNDGNFMGFEFGVGLPIFTGATKARVKAAKKERELLQLQNQNEAATRRSEYTMASNRLLAAKSRLEYFTSMGNSDAAKSADISAKAYDSGEIDYIEYVSALQQSIDTQLKYASAINDYNQAVITLQTLNGSVVPPESAALHDAN